MNAPPVTAARRAHQAALTGMGLMAIAMLAYPNMDAIAKVLSRSLPVLEIVWVRYLFQSLILLPLALWQRGRSVLRLAQVWAQLLRASLHVLAGVLFFNSVARVPLADSLAVFFVSPLVITVLSVPLLGERLGPWRVCAVIAGFLGVLLIIRPGFATVSSGLLLALGAGGIHALFAILSRKLAGSESPLVGTLIIGLTGTAVLAAVMPLVWVWPSPLQWGLMGCMGLIAAICQWLVTKSYEHAPASQLAPFAYLEIVSATLLGLALFGDFPEALTWLGIAIVVASGIVIAWRESVRARGPAGMEVAP